MTENGRAAENGNGSAREVKPGLGLGLSIVQAIAEAHDAELTTIARPEGGLRVAVAFRIAEPDRRS